MSVGSEIGAHDGAKIISLAEYRRGLVGSDDDPDPPRPCVAARPAADLLRMEARPASFWHPRSALKLSDRKSVQPAAFGHAPAKAAVGFW